MKKNDKLSKLAAMMDTVVKDDPHEAKKSPARKQVRKQPAKPKASTGQGSAPRNAVKPKPAPVGARERTAVNLTPGAVGALKQIQAFLITDCDAKSVSTSAAMCIALETTAELLEQKKAELGHLYQELKRTDGRRKQVA
jgi:hypothetical protein